MREQICDLHTHSTCSDGTDTPRELVEKAVEQGLGALALTDHNTIAGLRSFMEAGSAMPIITVPGVEFSTDYNGVELHVVGLFIEEVQYEAVTSYLEEMRLAKEESNKNLIRNLKQAGYDVDYEEVKAFAPSDNINRAVIANYLVSKGVLATVSEGFQSLLTEKGGYYVPPRKHTTFDTIRFVKSIGAVAVLAHPLLKFSMAELETFLPEAIVAGLDAMETNYVTFTEEEQQALRELACRYQLLESGGSDYHGTVKPDVFLGKGTGNLVVPYSFYENLFKKYTKN